jgi:hypothetical protein
LNGARAFFFAGLLVDMFILHLIAHLLGEAALALTILDSSGNRLSAAAFLHCWRRNALIVACILPFNHTQSALPTSRTIESRNQNLSMALVNQTLPFRTRRLGEYQQSCHRVGGGKRKDKSPRRSWPRALE